jgi:hypothetical protein
MDAQDIAYYSCLCHGWNPDFLESIYHYYFCLSPLSIIKLFQF